MDAGRDEILKTLGEYGYIQEDLVNSPGEYSWRGGVVDFFSSWQASPFRMEFSGDNLPPFENLIPLPSVQ